jgi:DNA-binding protein H-NS
MDERKRDSMIVYLRHRMDEFRISLDDLASMPAAEPGLERYRSAGGDTWNGEGETPRWLRQAISAGQAIAHFELSSGTVAKLVVQDRAEWTNDPFAGSRLARSSRH